MIKVYTSPGCGPCVAVKHAMRSRGVPFTEVNAREPEAQAYLEGLGYQGVPVTVCPDGQHWHGMDSERIVGLAVMVAS